MIRLGIMGYGNLAKGIECAVSQNKDFELKYVFTRRNPADLKINTKSAKVLPADKALEYKDDIDVLMICGGSATDLPEQTPYYSKYFDCVDSFDTHNNIPEHFNKVNDACMANDHITLISGGWDPGMFSINRLMANCILPEGKDYTFWGKGVSQGHSDAIRRIEGVLDARQYTIPVEENVNKVRRGENPCLSTRDKHVRECFVVVKEGYDKSKIEKEIKEMPNYFADYDTTVHFISKEELERDHKGLPHGGMVIRSGKTGVNSEHQHTIEYNLKLDSNPEFTGAVLIMYARAIYKMKKEGMRGCKTVFDVAPSYLSNLSPEEIRKHFL